VSYHQVGANHHLERKSPMPYVNHYSFTLWILTGAT